MSEQQRVLRDIRFEQQGKEMVLIVTAAVGREMVVERVPLGEASVSELMQTVQRALTHLATDPRVAA